MAKFKVEFENEIVTYTLAFRDKEFSYSMNQPFYNTSAELIGMKSNKPVFSVQIMEVFDDLSDSLLEDTNVNMLPYEMDCESELFTILESLEYLE